MATGLKMRSHRVRSGRYRQGRDASSEPVGKEVWVFHTILAGYSPPSDDKSECPSAGHWAVSHGSQHQKGQGNQPLLHYHLSKGGFVESNVHGVVLASIDVGPRV